jgi:hypothetical protein
MVIPAPHCRTARLVFNEATSDFSVATSATRVENSGFGLLSACATALALSSGIPMALKAS